MMHLALTRAGAAVAALVLAAPQGAAQEAAQPERTFATRVAPRAEGTRFMVAAAHPLAVAAARDILAVGGAAADAAIAAQFVLNLVEPQSSGIGGGSFLLYWAAADATLTTLDGLETAPFAATPAYWLGPDGAPRRFEDAVPGGLSVGIPGTLALLAELHRRHGRLPWADLLAPAIALAEGGFPVSPRLAAAIAEARDRGLLLFPDTAAYFLPGGTAPEPGANLQNPAFARTLRLIAAHGAAPFYDGALAGDLVAAVRNAPVNPGLMTRDDLRAYRMKERPPVCAPYRVYLVCGMGPPSSGGLAVGQVLMLLERFDLAALGDSPATWHLFAEALRLAFADRGLYMADSDFAAMPDTLLDPAYMAARSAPIAPDARMEKAPPGAPPWRKAEPRALHTTVELPGTSHLTIVDSRGDIAALTSSIETGFGSRLTVGGFLLNNELTDFSFAPEADGKPVANRVEGGNRPRSSMAPTIVFQGGRPVLALGSPGGARIIPYVAEALVRILDLGQDPALALAAGHVTPLPSRIEVEEGTDALALIPGLAALGHEVKIADLNSGLHVIRIIDGKLTGAADPRREGIVLGE